MAGAGLLAGQDEGEGVRGGVGGEQGAGQVDGEQARGAGVLGDGERGGVAQPRFVLDRAERGQRDGSGAGMVRAWSTYVTRSSCPRSSASLATARSGSRVPSACGSRHISDSP